MLFYLCTRADYRKGAKKAKVHLGFDINKGIPQKIFLTNGKKGERSFVEKIIAPGQTGVLDRGYQCHRNFDQWQESGRHFVCRIKVNTHKTVIRQIPLPESSAIFYDAIVLLGKPQINQTQKQLCLVGYEVLGTEYWVATDRLDLSADDIALIYKLRWDIGVSSQGHINQSVKVRPRTKDSNLVAGEAPWWETKMVKPSDKVLVKENMQSFRPQRIVNVDVASLHASPVAETVDNVRRQQEPHEMSLIQWFPPAGYQRWHGAKVYVETGEALGIRRRNPVEEANPITLNGKWMSRYQGGGLGRSTNDRCAAKRTSREGPRLMSIPGLICEAGVI